MVTTVTAAVRASARGGHARIISLNLGRGRHFLRHTSQITMCMLQTLVLVLHYHPCSLLPGSTGRQECWCTRACEWFHVLHFYSFIFTVRISSEHAASLIIRAT